MKFHAWKIIIYEGLLKHHIYSTTVPMATNLVRVVTYQKGILLIKSHDSLITWSYKVMWQAKNVSPLPMAIKFGRIVTHLDGSLLITSRIILIIWFLKITWQTKTIISSPSQDGDLSWGATLKVTWHWLHGLVRSFGKLNHSTVPMTTRHGRMETYLDGLLPIKAHDLLIMCFCNITWHTKTIISSVPQCSLQPNIT